MHDIDKNITVVIPTLGLSSIDKTINALNEGTIKPKEILLCIPRDFAHKIQYAIPPNVKILVTNMKGQVAQRQFGFRAAQCKYVLQLDDDIEVSKDCLLLLRDFLSETKQPACVAPTLVNTCHRDPIDHSPKHRVFSKLYYRILNGKEGYKESSILKCGLNTDMPSREVMKVPSGTQWLPGGAILHHRDRLVLQPFYPFSGKAYCEDLIHSSLIEKAGGKLFLHPEAIAYFSYKSKYSVKSFFEYLRNDFRARHYLVKITGRSTIRLCVYYIYISITQILSAIIRRIISNK